MVYAKKKLLLDRIFMEPDPPYTYVDYKGPNAQMSYNVILDLIKELIKPGPGEAQERAYSWEKTPDGESFTVSWEIFKRIDKYSLYKITIDLNGKTYKGIGEAHIILDGLLRTEYPQDTLWQRSLIYEILRMLWHRLIYEEKRQVYWENGRSLIRQMGDELKRRMAEYRGN